jgi:hypothetical protein
VPTVADHLDRRVLPDGQLSHGDDEFVGVSDGAVTYLDHHVVFQDAALLSGALLRVVAVLSPEGVRRNLLDTLNLGDMDESAEGAVDAAVERCVRDRCCRGRSAGTR